MESSHRTQINPWISIWLHPKKTMDSILETDPKRFILWLAVLGGVLFSISWVSYLWIQYPHRQELHQVLVVLAVILIGGLVGIIHLYLGGWLYQLTGSWIGGKGDFIQVKCAVGWANYPFIIARIFGLLNLVVIPHPWFQAIAGLLNAAFALWAFVIFINLLARAHRFSAWRAILSFFITLFLVFVALMIICLLVPLLSPLFIM